MRPRHDLTPALALTTPAGRRGPELRWLARSHADPQGFGAAVHELLAAVAEPGPKSGRAGPFDLYHELVVRHLGAGRPALRVHDPRATQPAQRWRVLSYEQLHARCGRRAASWAARGVEPGAKLCVVQRFDDDAVVSLLSALRLGACLSWLEPGGPDSLARRLAALAPDFIATQQFFAALLGEPEPPAPLLLSEDDGDATAPGSHAYAADEPCALLFSPLRRPPDQPVELRAEACYFGAVRDGALSLALRPDDALAAPGFADTQHQPALLFAALMLGACYVHIDEAELVGDPSLLAELPLRSLGVGAAVRDALLAAPGLRLRCAHVFRRLEEPCDWLAWRDFVELLGLEATPMSNLLIDAAAGGCLLGSPRRPGDQHLAHLMDAAPAPGRAWTLLDFSGAGQPTPADVGVFAALEGVREPGDEGVAVEPMHVVLGRRRGLEFLYGGTVEPRRSGQVFPAQELLEALADCPFLDGASVVAIAAGGATLAWRFLLLGFVGAEPEHRFRQLAQARVDELRRVVETRLGAEFLPDEIELFPYHARRRAGEVDQAWCRAQYLGGVLARKLRTPAFRRLSELRRVVLAGR